MLARDGGADCIAVHAEVSGAESPGFQAGLQGELLSAKPQGEAWWKYGNR